MNIPRFSPRPSKQCMTLYPLHQAETKENLQAIEYVSPQMLCFHSDCDSLQRVVPKLTERMRNRFPSIGLAIAIAGDRNTDAERRFKPWVDTAVMSHSLHMEWFQFNCENWRNRPAGQLREGINMVHDAAPALRLVHTSHGAPVGIDKDKSTPGHQNWGGHSEAKYPEAVGQGSPVEATAHQWYFGRPQGELADPSYGTLIVSRYQESVELARKLGVISDHVEDWMYLQMYDSNQYVLCSTAERTALTQWWSAPGRMDDVGLESAWVMSRLFEAGKTIKQFQQENQLDPDGKVGHKTKAALRTLFPAFECDDIR